MIIKEFFAVTQTSVYEIQAEGEDGKPSVVKIALHVNSITPVGHKLANTDMISVGRNIIGYIPEKYGLMHPLTGSERNISKVNISFWGGNTSLVIALFENEEDAMECSAESDLKPCDPRWIEQTRQVLEVIGNAHPVFFVPYDDLALIQ